MLFQELVNKWAQNANTAEIVNGRREKGKCKDYKLLLNFIKRILDFGMQLGAIEDNSATKVFPPKLKTRTSNKIKYFDNVELKQFLTYLDTLEPTITNQKNITLYKLLLTTGLRVGEALALSWSDINFSDKSVSITKSIDSTKQRDTRRNKDKRK